MPGYLIDESEVRRRYLNDPKYKTCVDVIYNMIAAGYLNTHEVAEAAVLATQLYAERHVTPFTVILKRDGGCIKCGHTCPTNRLCDQCGGDPMGPKDLMCVVCDRKENP